VFEKLDIKNVDLKNGAVLIADVHYKKGDLEFLSLLEKWIHSPPPQVFFLGDVFHLLLPFRFLINYNRDAVELIEKLAEKTEVYYTYGNHDFNIGDVFKNVTFADAFLDKKKGVFLTHGDLSGDENGYMLYAKIIRNGTVEKVLNILSLNFLNGWLFKNILKKKIICEKIKDFDKIVKKKWEKIDYDIIIEGHYHQNRMVEANGKKYINLPAFVCTKSYNLIQLDNNPILKEIKYDR